MALPETTALYRARATDADGKSKRFRLFLWTDGEERLHAEVIAPVGGTVAVLDGHPGKFSASFPRDREAYVGTPDGDTFRRLIGVGVDLGDWIATLVGRRAAPSGIVVEREGAPGRYPDRLVLRDGPVGLQLELRRLAALPPDGAPLGTGEPPPGHETWPLSTLAADALPVVAEPDDHGRTAGGEGR